jgi:hypothetical protein
VLRPPVRGHGQQPPGKLGLDALRARILDAAEDRREVVERTLGERLVTASAQQRLLERYGGNRPVGHDARRLAASASAAGRSLTGSAVIFSRAAVDIPQQDRKHTAARRASLSSPSFLESAGTSLIVLHHPRRRRHTERVRVDGREPLAVRHQRIQVVVEALDCPNATGGRKLALHFNRALKQDGRIEQRADEDPVYRIGRVAVHAGLWRHKNGRAAARAVHGPNGELVVVDRGADVRVLPGLMELAERAALEVLVVQDHGDAVVLELLPHPECQARHYCRHVDGAGVARR